MREIFRIDWALIKRKLEKDINSIAEIKETLIKQGCSEAKIKKFEKICREIENSNNKGACR